jgi:DNA repair exonuclease SbcCD nuclease subunit
MSRLKILHAADFHLDTPFEGIPEEKALQRRREQRELLLSLTELARREHADLILLPGDLLDGEKNSFETESTLLRALGSVSCPVVIAPGNHDYYTEKSLWARLKFPDNVFIFRTDAIQTLELEEIGVRVFGAAYTDRSCRPLLEGFHAEKYPGTLNLLCLHAEVDAKDSRYCPVSSARLAGSGIDYAAFGHVHRASGLLRSGDTWYSWPGCPEGRGFDETGERFVNLVELENGQCRMRQVSIALRRYEQLQVDVTGADPLLAVHSSLPDDTVCDVYRITLVGETDAAPDLRRLYQNLSELFFALQLRDETRLRRGIGDCVGEDTLRGLFLGRLKARFDAAATEEERVKLEQAARWGLAALDNGEEVAQHEDR